MRKLSLLALIAVMVSCVRLDLKTTDDSTVFSAISFSVKWPAGVNPQDTVRVAMNAVSEPLKYVYNLDNQGNVYMDKVDTVVADYANYVFLACSCDERTVTLDGPSSFLSSSGRSLRDFRANLLTLTDAEVADLIPDGVKDFNSNTPFLSQPEVLCYDLQKYQVSDTDDNTFAFNLHSLVLNLELKVRIIPQDGVSIGEVVGEVAGLPSSVSLFTGAVSQTEQGRVIFSMSRQGVLYSATFRALGIFPPESSNLYSGPGILRLRLSATWGGETRLLYPAINLRNLILASGVMAPVQNGDGYKIATDRVTIEVPVSLVVGKDSFIAGDGGEGVDTWFDSEKTFDVEI